MLRVHTVGFKTQVASSPAVARVGRPYLLYPKASDFREWVHDMVMLLYQTLKSTPGCTVYMTYSRLTHQSNFLHFLPIRAWILFTAYRISSSPYPTALLPTP